MSTSAPDPGTDPALSEPAQPAPAQPDPGRAEPLRARDRPTPPAVPVPPQETFDPFRFGRPEPGSPAAAAFPHLFPPQPQPYAAPGQRLGASSGDGPNPGWTPPGWGAPGGPGYPPPTPGTGLGYPPPGPGDPPVDPSAGASIYRDPANGADSGYPPPYGYAYPPPGGGSRPGNGKAVAGFVLGLVGVVLFFVTLFDLIPIVLAFVFSIQGLQASKRGKGQRGLAVAGVVLASIATVIVLVFVTFLAIRVNHCQKHHDQGTKSYNECLINF